MGNMGWARAARTMIRSLDKKRSLERCSTMPWSYLIMGTCAPSRPPSRPLRTLFEGDPATPGHPLRVETENKLGDCVLKIRCHICRSLISYHNSSWTCKATHIQSHNIATTQDIAAAAALASESEANGEAFPIHKLPNPPPVKKEAVGDAALMRRTFVAPSYRTDTQPYHRIKRTIAKWIVVDCLPYRTVETVAFTAMTRSLDPKCPDFGRKAITS